MLSLTVPMEITVTSVYSNTVFILLLVYACAKLQTVPQTPKDFNLQTLG